MKPLAWLPLLAVLAAATAGAAQVERVRYAMGTLLTARAAGADSTAVAAALERALNEVDRLEQVMSSWRPGSELAQLNRAAAATAPASAVLSADLYAALRAALATAVETQGAFDPTVGPLLAAWDIQGRGRVPGKFELAAARARVGWQRLTLDSASRTVRFQAPGMALDLGGIGKGFALDRAAQLLRAAGVENCHLNFGGEVSSSGASDELPHTVEIADPGRRMQAVVVLPVYNQAVSTSGSSERGFRAGGRRYSHVLDPRTGRPVESPASVTVVCAGATRADALSTGLLVMGREGAREFSWAHADVGVLWLEPGPRGVRVWSWNVNAVASVPGARLEWVEREINPLDSPINPEGRR